MRWNLTSKVTPTPQPPTSPYIIIFIHKVSSLNYHLYTTYFLHLSWFYQGTPFQKKKIRPFPTARGAQDHHFRIPLLAVRTLGFFPASPPLFTPTAKRWTLTSNVTPTLKWSGIHRGHQPVARTAYKAPYPLHSPQLHLRLPFTFNKWSLTSNVTPTPLPPSPHTLKCVSESDYITSPALNTSISTIFSRNGGSLPPSPPLHHPEEIPTKKTKAQVCPKLAPDYSDVYCSTANCQWTLSIKEYG